MLNSSQIQFEWDDGNLAEVEQGKTLYRAARDEGRKILHLDGTTMESFRAKHLGFIIAEKELTEDQFQMNIIDDSGDKILTWDKTRINEIEEAAKIFNEYSSKGWRGYCVNQDGTKGKRIHSFDFKKEEILFDDKTIAESLKDFISKVKKITLLPKTHRG